MLVLKILNHIRNCIYSHRTLFLLTSKLDIKTWHQRNPFHFSLLNQTPHEISAPLLSNVGGTQRTRHMTQFVDKYVTNSSSSCPSCGHHQIKSPEKVLLIFVFVLFWFFFVFVYFFFFFFYKIIGWSWNSYTTWSACWCEIWPYGSRASLTFGGESWVWCSQASSFDRWISHYSMGAWDLLYTSPEIARWSKPIDSFTTKMFKITQKLCVNTLSVSPFRLSLIKCVYLLGNTPCKGCFVLLSNRCGISQSTPPLQGPASSLALVSFSDRCETPSKSTPFGAQRSY